MSARHRSFAIAALAILFAAGPSRALVPVPEADAYAIPLPFPRDFLLYRGQAASPAATEAAASFGQALGGEWAVHSWNRRSGTPHIILGSGADVAPALGDPSDAEAAARTVFQRNAAALGVDPARLRLDEVRSGAGKYAVHFQETYDGVDVIGGRVHATFMASGRLFVMGSDFYSIENLDVAPAISQVEAERIALDDLPQRERLVSPQAGEETKLFVLPYPTSDESFEPFLVWRVTVLTDGRSGVWKSFVDARTGVIVWRYNDVHYVNYTGITDGNVQPVTWCNGEQGQVLKYQAVVIPGVGSASSNGNGLWTIPNNDNTPRAANSSFFGPFVDVNRVTGGSDAVLSLTATPGVPLEFGWTDANSRQDERDVFNAISDIHDFFEIIDPGYSFSNARITANVGIADACNAFWNGSSINFFDAGVREDGTQCSNTGEIQSVVDHEFGHGVQNNLIGGQGSEGLGEGNADVLANLMTGESIIARGVKLNCAFGFRDSDNSFQYPEDLNGEEHHDGRIIAGVMWNTLENLQASLGSGPGLIEAASIWHFGRKLEQPTNQPDQCLSMFIADDDNGNIFDGTPHFDDLCSAVMAHDIDGDAFDCPESGSVWVDFANSGTENGSQQHPYNSVFQAQSASSPGYIMKARTGISTETGTLFKAGVIRALGGPVRVGGP